MHVRSSLPAAAAPVNRRVKRGMKRPSYVQVNPLSYSRAMAKLISTENKLKQLEIDSLRNFYSVRKLRREVNAAIVEMTGGMRSPCSPPLISTTTAE